MGHRLIGDGIPKIVVRHSESAGSKKQMSPHRIRHSAIMAALDATDGDVRKVQKLPRHGKLDTLMIYDDNQGRDQQDQDLRRHTTYSVPKKGLAFSLLKSVNHQIKNFIAQKITDSLAKQ